MHFTVRPPGYSSEKTPVELARRAALDCLDAVVQWSDLLRGIRLPDQISARGAKRLAADAATCLSSLALAVGNGSELIHPVVEYLDAAAQQPIVIKVPKQPLDPALKAVTGSNLHGALLDLADLVLAGSWSLLDPVDYSRTQETPNPIAKFKAERLAAFVPSKATDLKKIVPAVNRADLESRCVNESARAALHWKPADPPKPSVTTKSAEADSLNSRLTTHSDDFASVIWYGQPYTFTKTQAACIRVLWQNWQRGVPDVGQERILDAARSEARKVSYIFRRSPAWKTLIISKKKGMYRLNVPVDSKSPS